MWVRRRSGPCPFTEDLEEAIAAAVDRAVGVAPQQPPALLAAYRVQVWRRSGPARSPRTWKRRSPLWSTAPSAAFGKARIGRWRRLAAAAGIARPYRMQVWRRSGF
jgi:hypothetical protein